MLCLVTLSSGWSQELRVTSVVKVQDDFLFDKDQRVDANGKKAALLKVLIPVPGCQFEGSTIGKVEYKANEYWVYLEQGIKLLRVRCPGCPEALLVDMSPWIGSSGVEGNKIYELRVDGWANAMTSSSTSTGLRNISGHAYVDLGLSVKWAKCNVGASSPEEYGEYYAWGEVSTKSEYVEGNSVTDDKSMGDIGGNATYDVARAKWGGSWRLPTEEECQELINECEWTWTTRKGVAGYIVTSKVNGKSIFLPAAGLRDESYLYGKGSLGRYWTSSPRSSSTYYAYALDIGSDGGDYYNNFWFDRYIGLSVRPVSE